MQSAAQRRDPAFVNKVVGMVEGGMSAEEIAKELLEEQAQKRLLQEETEKLNRMRLTSSLLHGENIGPNRDDGELSFDGYTISNEIRTIAQALCFRYATEEDLPELKKVLSSCYEVEVNEASSSTLPPSSGSNACSSDASSASAPHSTNSLVAKLQQAEGFRRGKALPDDAIESLFFNDPSFKWLIVEAPNGHGIEKDGVILGASCFSTDGISKRNGEKEGFLGSIRYFGVLPRFQGLCVGLRLLKRTETEMMKAKCVRVMCCIPSTRVSVHKWLERKGYKRAGEMPYPFVSLGHEPSSMFDKGDASKGTVSLIVFLKPLQEPSLEADYKDPETTVLTINKIGSEVKNNDNGAEATPESGADGCSPPPPPPAPGVPTPLPQIPGKMALPPHWRLATSAVLCDDEAAADGK